jgi:hypothetical protein
MTGRIIDPSYPLHPAPEVGDIIRFPYGDWRVECVNADGGTLGLVPVPPSRWTTIKRRAGVAALVAWLYPCALLSTACVAFAVMFAGACDAYFDWRDETLRPIWRGLHHAIAEQWRGHP